MLRGFRWLCGSALLGLLHVPAIADSIDVAAAKFGALPTVTRLGISPLGDKVVLIGTRTDGGQNAVVVDLATTKSTPVLSVAGRTERLTGCEFVLEQRLVCSAFLMRGAGVNIQSASRLLVVATDGSGSKLLSAPPRAKAYYRPDFGGNIIDYNVEGDPDAVLVVNYDAPEEQTGTMLAGKSGGLGVQAVNLKTLARKTVERARRTANDYYTDGSGHIRLLSLVPQNEDGYQKQQIVFQIRSTASNSWRDISVVKIDAGLSEGFVPLSVKPGTDQVYGFDSNNGRKALFLLDAAAPTAKPELLVATDKGDVESLVQLGRKQRVVGASWVGEKREVQYFDPELKKLANSLSGALPGHPDISFGDASADEKKLVVFATSDVDPGAYYLFDRGTKKLGKLMDARSELVDTTLATMKAVLYPAQDGTMVPAYLTLPPGSNGRGLPAIVMPHGGPQARDEWGFDWLVQYYASQGYAVLQPNYRGSSGYGAAWFQKNGYQSWKAAIGDVNAAGRWLVSQGIAAPEKLAIVGWSYGGYAALQSAVLDPTLFKAIVAVAPVTDLDRVKDEARKFANYRLVENFVGSGPHIAEGSPARHADRFQAPVMLFHGDMDTNVGVGESRLMNDRLKAAGKSVTYTEFAGLDHQLEDAAARRKLLSESDRFLRRVLGISVQ